MYEAFALYEEWGVKGVKVDYMNRKDQEIVAFYHGTLAAAARHHLAVDFHGAYAGAGEERTWPNCLTREGVMGLEYLKWSDRATPRHNVTIPFTRMILGPMDYTPGGFRNVTIEEFAPRRLAPLAMGTRAHQLAMYVVYESPLQMLVDYPDAYRGQPGAEFLKGRARDVGRDSGSRRRDRRVRRHRPPQRRRLVCWRHDRPAADPRDSPGRSRRRIIRGHDLRRTPRNPARLPRSSGSRTGP